jgi:hypothetical protein
LNICITNYPALLLDIPYIIDNNMYDLIPYRRRGAVGPSFLQLDSEDLRGLTSRFGIGIDIPRKKWNM